MDMITHFMGFCRRFGIGRIRGEGRLFGSTGVGGVCSGFATQFRRFATGLHFGGRRAFANEARIEVEATSVGPSLGCAANASDETAAPEWMRLAAYGDHPYGAVDVQVFDRAGAEDLARRFKATANGLLGRILRSNPRRPVYAGHPDHPAFSAQGHDDFTLRGEIEDLEAREDGLYAKTKFSSAGRELLAGGEKLYWSPRWVTAKLTRAGPKAYWQPHKLLSAGLVATPNIHGSAANAAQINDDQGDQMELLKKMLVALGYTAEQAEAIASGAEGAPTAAEVLGKMKPAPKEEDKKPEEKEKLDAANAARVTAEAATTAALADLANERTGRATLIVERAMEDGRLVAADREAKIVELSGSKDFANAATALLTQAKVLPSGGRADKLGKRKGEMADMANAQETFNSALKDFANSAGLSLETDYQKVYGRFKVTAKAQELLAKMGGNADE